MQHPHMGWKGNRLTLVRAGSTAVCTMCVSVVSDWSTSHLIHSVSTLVDTIISEAGGMVMEVVV